MAFGFGGGTDFGAGASLGSVGGSSGSFGGFSGILGKLKMGGGSQAPSEDDPSLEGIPGAADEIGSEVTGPTRRYQARLIGLAPRAVGIGSSIQPVATTRGGAQMAHAAATEREGATRMLLTESMGDLERRYRNVMAESGIAKNSAAIIRRLVTEYFSGGVGG